MKAIPLSLFTLLFISHSAIAQKADSSVYAVFNSDSVRDEIRFPDYKRSATLDKSEIMGIFRLFSDGIKKFDSKVDTTTDYYRQSVAEDPKNRSRYILDPSDYFLQIVPYVDSNGNKIAYVFGTCCGKQTSDSHRRKRLEIVQDGGPCYLSFTINVTSKELQYFWVNDSP